MTLAALKRGDKVIATARGRSFAKLADLKEQGAEIMELDVNAPLDVLHAAAKKAVDVYGHVDVVVNNAGRLYVLWASSEILMLSMEAISSLEPSKRRREWLAL